MYRVRVSVIMPDGTRMWQTKRDIPTWQDTIKRIEELDADVSVGKYVVKSILITNLKD